MTTKPTSASDVLVYVPNLIGYSRVILTLTSLILMICFPEKWIFATVLYVSSFVGDLFDGMAARKFDQCSTFGGLIDMVTDRCSTAGLLCALSKEYSESAGMVLVSFCFTFFLSFYWIFATIPLFVFIAFLPTHTQFYSMLCVRLTTFSSSRC